MLHKITGVGLPNVYLTGGFVVEGAGDDETVAYADLEGLYFAIARQIALRATRLSGAELRFLRRRLGMTQGEAANLVDKTDQVLAKWEKDELPVPYADGAILRLRWLAEKSRRDLVKAAGVLTRLIATEPATHYVFAYENGRWAEDRTISAFAIAGGVMADAIGRARATASAYTNKDGGVAVVRPIRSDNEGTTT